MPLQTDEEVKEQIQNQYSDNVDKSFIDNLCNITLEDYFNILQSDIRETDIQGLPDSNLLDTLNKINQSDYLDIIRNIYRVSGFKYKGPPPTKTKYIKEVEIKILCFYYMNFAANGELIIREYRVSLDYVINDIKRELIIKKIAGITSNPTETNITIGSEKIKCTVTSNPSFKWNGATHICFVMDKDGWEFHKENKDQVNALHFATRNSKYRRNHSFFNATQLDTKINGNNRTVLICENLHLDTRFRFRGKPRPVIRPNNYKEDHYKFDLFFRVTIECSNDSRRETIIIDPTGTNFGPP